MLAVGCQSTASDESGVDVDMSILSGTMAYAEAYNMEQNAEDYMGKTIRLSGVYAYYQDKETQAIRGWAMVTDATACCSTGFELAFDDSYVYPDDYPERGDVITVVGTFSLNPEMAAIGYNSLLLENAVLESIK